MNTTMNSILHLIFALFLISQVDITSSVTCKDQNTPCSGVGPCLDSQVSLDTIKCCGACSIMADGYDTGVSVTCEVKSSTDGNVVTYSYDSICHAECDGIDLTDAAICTPDGTVGTAYCGTVANGDCRCDGTISCDSCADGTQYGCCGQSYCTLDNTNACVPFTTDDSVCSTFTDTCAGKTVAEGGCKCDGLACGTCADGTTYGCCDETYCALDTSTNTNTCTPRTTDDSICPTTTTPKCAGYTVLDGDCQCPTDSCLRCDDGSTYGCCDDSKCDEDTSGACVAIETDDSICQVTTTTCTGTVAGGDCKCDGGLSCEICADGDTKYGCCGQSYCGLDTLTNTCTARVTDISICPTITKCDGYTVLDGDCKCDGLSCDTCSDGTTKYGCCDDFPCKETNGICSAMTRDSYSSCPTTTTCEGTVLEGDCKCEPNACLRCDDGTIYGCCDDSKCNEDDDGTCVAIETTNSVCPTVNTDECDGTTVQDGKCSCDSRCTTCSDGSTEYGCCDDDSSCYVNDAGICTAKATDSSVCPVDCSDKDDVVCADGVNYVSPNQDRDCEYDECPTCDNNNRKARDCDETLEEPDSEGYILFTMSAAFCRGDARWTRQTIWQMYKAAYNYVIQAYGLSDDTCFVEGGFYVEDYEFSDKLNAGSTNGVVTCGEDCDPDDLQYTAYTRIALFCDDYDALGSAYDKLIADSDLGTKFIERCLALSAELDEECGEGFGEIDIESATVMIFTPDGEQDTTRDTVTNSSNAQRNGYYIAIVVFMIIFTFYC